MRLFALDTVGIVTVVVVSCGCDLTFDDAVVPAIADVMVFASGICFVVAMGAIERAT